MALFCPICGTKAYEDSLFCSSCGSNLATPDSSQNRITYSPIQQKRAQIHRHSTGFSRYQPSPHYRRPSNIKWVGFAIIFIIILGFAVTTSLIGLILNSNDLFPDSSSGTGFQLIEYELTSFEPGETHFRTIISNEGVILQDSGLVFISWEDCFIEIPLINGEGTLDESILNMDLNGNGNKVDEFDFSWFSNDERQWDMIINDGTQYLHVYSIFEGPEWDPGSIRTYYVDGQEKFFQLGNQTHALYKADNERAFFGLNNAIIVNHPNPCFELLIDSRINVTGIKINDIPVAIDFMQTFVLNERGKVWNTTAYMIPLPSPEILGEEPLSFSCVFQSSPSLTSDLYLHLNWSPDGFTRKLWRTVEYYEFPFDGLH